MSKTSQHAQPPAATEKDPVVDISEGRVLIIDDEITICELIRFVLATIGINTVETANNGKEGLSKIRDFRPDLIILDLKMPVMDGFEVLEKLKADPKLSEIPVIVETGQDAPEDRARVLSMGAKNIISKPLDHNLLASRVRLHMEVRLLIRNLKEYQKRVEEELSTARNMQKDLLPRQHQIAQVEAQYNCKFDSHYSTSSELGGDFWGIQTVSKSSVGMFIVDFSGHGVSAAINTFRLHTVLVENPQIESPARYLEFLNRHLCDLIPRGQFATMFYGVFDTTSEKLTYSAAAAPNPIFVFPDDGGLVVGNGSGLPLGISPQAEYQNQTVDFPRGTSLFMYSDAFYESPQLDGSEIGMDGVATFVSETIQCFDHGSSSGSVLNQILERFYQHRKQPLADDLTAVWFTWRGQ